MFKKINSWLLRKLWPYWCPFCEGRFRKKDEFEKHYLEERPLFLEDAQKRKFNRARRRVLQKKMKQNRKKGRH